MMPEESTPFYGPQSELMSLAPDGIFAELARQTMTGQRHLGTHHRR